MENRQTVLDAPDVAPQPATIRLHRVFVVIEILLICITLFGALLRSESWEGTSELIILLMTGLMLFYFLLAPFVFGSVGIRRHLGAYLCGFAIMLGIAAKLFRIEGWHSGPELAIVSSMLSLMVAFSVFILAIVRKQTGHKSPAFFWWLLLRLIVIAGLNAWAILELFR